MKETFTYFTFKGRRVFKSPYEYFSPTASIYGWPYYYITEDNKTHYLYELNQENLESQTYHLIETSTDFPYLHRLALEKSFATQKANTSDRVEPFWWEDWNGKKTQYS
ncbi:MAG: hypothetical protein AAGJ18_04540 [Bacteroidota bacterium]